MSWVLILIFGGAQAMPLTVVLQEFTTLERCDAARAVLLRAATAAIPLRAQGCFQK